MRTLTHDEARRVYDRIGPRQDAQAFYEDRSLDLLIERMAFGDASAVFELGCGPARFGERLLESCLPDHGTYDAVDLSPRMCGIARARLARFGPRARVEETEGLPPAAVPEGHFDRFVSTYVLDLLAEDDARAWLAEAARLLRPGGWLGLAGLGTGAGPVSTLVASVWSAVHRRSPALVGGCRPQNVVELIPTAFFETRYRTQLTPFGLASEIVIARRR